ncbi:MAG: acyl carrier protein [Pseudomonadota bacterium]|jgi:acyl carrier protein|nr:hypothetical protein [Rhodanobacter sp.]
MSVEDFVEKFTFAIESEPGSIQANTEYKSLKNWDSLNALSLIAMADADYNVALAGNDIQSSTTVADLWKIVQERMG